MYTSIALIDRSFRRTDKKVFEYDDADDEPDVDINLDSEVKEKKVYFSAFSPSDLTHTLINYMFRHPEHTVWLVPAAVWQQGAGQGRPGAGAGEHAPSADDQERGRGNRRQVVQLGAGELDRAEARFVLLGRCRGQKGISFFVLFFHRLPPVFEIICSGQAMEEALTRILTPRRPVDILHGIQSAKEQGRPYTVVFCGVNGVGKSTSLAKITNFLQAHSFKVHLNTLVSLLFVLFKCSRSTCFSQVSLVACDTFRAGAVEQLRTHSKCLGASLFEQGYDKDAALVAQSGIRAAKTEGASSLIQLCFAACL
jgi:hypothetical protein